MSDGDVQLSLMPDIAPAYDASLAQWFTPPKLARRIARSFVARRKLVVEPTAGSGSLIKAALEAESETVLAMDVDPRWIEHIRERFADVYQPTPALGGRSPQRVQTLRMDYLKTGPSFDVRGATVFMNPPDASREGIDVADFMVKAMHDAGPSGDVVALLRLNCLAGVDRREVVWSVANILNVAYLSRRPAYGEGGGKQEWCVVRYQLPRGKRDPIQRPQTEWWGDAWN